MKKLQTGSVQFGVGEPIYVLLTQEDAERLSTTLQELIQTMGSVFPDSTLRHMRQWKDLIDQALAGYGGIDNRLLPLELCLHSVSSEALAQRVNKLLPPELLTVLIAAVHKATGGAEDMNFVATNATVCGVKYSAVVQRVDGLSPTEKATQELLRFANFIAEDREDGLTGQQLIDEWQALRGD